MSEVSFVLSELFFLIAFANFLTLLYVCVTMFQLSIYGAAIWINPFVGILTIIALWPVAIMFMHLRVTLRSIKIIPKYAMYQVGEQEEL